MANVRHLTCYAYIHMCLYISLSLSLSLYIYIYIIFMRARVCPCACACVCVCVRAWYVCVPAYLCVCVCVCVCVLCVCVCVLHGQARHATYALRFGAARALVHARCTVSQGAQPRPYYNQTCLLHTATSHRAPIIRACHTATSHVCAKQASLACRVWYGVVAWVEVATC